MLASVKVEHKVDQRPFESGAYADVDGEASAGDFCRAFKIENSKVWSEVPVGFGLEVKLLRNTPFLDLDIGVGILAGRNGLVRDVRNARQQLPEVFVQRGSRLFQSGSLLSESAHFCLQRFGIFAGLFAPA